MVSSSSNTACSELLLESLPILTLNNPEHPATPLHLLVPFNDTFHTDRHVMDSPATSGLKPRARKLLLPLLSSVSSVKRVHSTLEGGRGVASINPAFIPLQQHQREALHFIFVSIALLSGTHPCPPRQLSTTWCSALLCSSLALHDLGMGRLASSYQRPL